jgi:hypothetical protein
LTGEIFSKTPAFWTVFITIFNAAQLAHVPYPSVHPAHTFQPDRGIESESL